MNRYEQLRDEARVFHESNPRCWRLFEYFTFDRISKGFKHYSAAAIFERIRWETDFADSDGNATFKLNNNHRTFYARAFMKRHPEHKGFFRTRMPISVLSDAKGG